ncbi:hypothetical protein D3C71_2015090 [compost metagenome]
MAKSSFSLAVRPSSVVHTGVKSAGWENNTPQLLPSHSWKRILPSLESCSKSGAISPSLRLMGCGSWAGFCTVWVQCACIQLKTKRINNDLFITITHTN